MSTWDCAGDAVIIPTFTQFNQCQHGTVLVMRSLFQHKHNPTKVNMEIVLVMQSAI
jgi:hypothetical protein